MNWTREDIEAIRELDRPRVRCRISRRNVDQDGHYSDPTYRDIEGSISLDGNNPWLTIRAAGEQHAERFSWGLILEVLNDKFAAPICFNKEFVYEV